MIWILTALAEPVVAVVVVDEVARDQGYALSVDGWRVTDALPVDVLEGERLELLDPDGRAEALDVQPGEAWEVTGVQGEAWMSRLGEAVDPDRFVVRGPVQAVEALAAELDARIVNDGARTFLVGDRVLLRAGWVEDPEAREVTSVGLVAPEATTVERPASPWVDPVRVPPAQAPARPGGSGMLPATAGSADQAPAAVAPSDPRGLADAAFETERALRMKYAGAHLCSDQVVWLGKGGRWAYAGGTGTWAEGAPGLLRLSSDAGESWFKMAFEGRRCRGVWTADAP